DYYILIKANMNHTNSPEDNRRNLELIKEHVIASGDMVTMEAIVAKEIEVVSIEKEKRRKLQPRTHEVVFIREGRIRLTPRGLPQIE
ncbi:hypothetical protein, partial [Bacteroides sp. 51]|uniref:hypothetical protein n=1 Tax=Bacteroides sp. 51 TaxID=2302938 RepID=UPI0019402B30